MYYKHILSNKEIVQILKEVLAAMEVKNYNRFKIRAYQTAISSIEGLTLSVYELYKNNKLHEIAGVGPGLKKHFTDLFERGFSDEFNEAVKDLPEGMFTLIGIRGIGAKKAFKLAEAFNITKRENSLEILKDKASNRQIRILEGFGEKSEKDILEAITEAKMTKNEKPRLLLIKAEEISNRLVNYMNKCSGILRIEVLGSLRRRNSTVGDLDIAVSTKNTNEVIKHFLKYSEIKEKLAEGDRKVSIVLHNDVQVDLRTADPKEYGSMMQYFTGNKRHNIILRTFALERGFSLSEYGIKINNKLMKFTSEKAFYNKLGLDYIPPEIRQGKSEINAAFNHDLPSLIKISDIKGDIHIHTDFSDGINTLEDMVKKSKSIGYEYIGITDHAPSVQVRGLKTVLQIIKEQKERIKKLSKKLNIKILFGYEVNILADATLSLPDECMKELDYVIASIHSSFNQDRFQITKRLTNALKNPFVNVIGHPSGRLLNERDSCDVNWVEVFQTCLAQNKVLEINSQPSRLDLADDLVSEALNIGNKFVINTDSHSLNNFEYMCYGVDVARRGWCEKKDIVNTFNFDKFVKVLKIRNQDVQ